MAARKPGRIAKGAAQPRRGAAAPGRPRHLPILLTVALVTMLVLVFVAVRWYLTPAAPGQVRQGQAGQVMAALAAIPQSELESIGRGTSSVDLKPVSAQPLTGARGKPQVLYVGAEYCPYCAAQRWSLAVALSRFGTLTGVGLTSSSSSDAFPDTPTLSFRGSSYASNYLDFVAVETADRQGAQLDKVSPDQQALMQRYDAPPYSTAGGIPFVDLGNRFVTSGAAYSPGLLQGMDQQQVVAALQNPSSAQAKAILGSANVFTAALCRMTGQQPANVCGTPAIHSIQASIGGSGG
jgi:Domain of unknown function (DUF929)